MLKLLCLDISQTVEALTVKPTQNGICAIQSFMNRPTLSVSVADRDALGWPQRNAVNQNSIDGQRISDLAVTAPPAVSRRGIRPRKTDLYAPIYPPPLPHLPQHQLRAVLQLWSLPNCIATTTTFYVSPTTNRAAPRRYYCTQHASFSILRNFISP